MALATTETLLENLIKLSMVEDAPASLFKGNGACSILSSKIDTAFALGLLSKTECREIHLLRKIRNEFAHAINHELDFNNNKISNWTRGLSIPDVDSVDGKGAVFKSCIVMLQEADLLSL